MMWYIVGCCWLPWYPTLTSLEPPSDFSYCRSFRVTSDSHCHGRDPPRAPATNLPAFCSQDFSNTMQASAWIFRGINATKGNSQPMRESRGQISAPDFIVQKKAFCMLLRGSKIIELLLLSVAISSMHTYRDFSSFRVPFSFFLLFTNKRPASSLALASVLGWTQNQTMNSALGTGEGHLRLE